MRTTLGPKWTVIYTAPWHDNHLGFMSHVMAYSPEEAIVRAVIEELGTGTSDEEVREAVQQAEVVLATPQHISCWSGTFSAEEQETALTAVLAQRAAGEVSAEASQEVPG